MFPGPADALGLFNRPPSERLALRPLPLYRQPGHSRSGSRPAASEPAGRQQAPGPSWVGTPHSRNMRRHCEQPGCGCRLYIGRHHCRQCGASVCLRHFYRPLCGLCHDTLKAAATPPPDTLLPAPPTEVSSEASSSEVSPPLHLPQRCITSCLARCLGQQSMDKCSRHATDGKPGGRLCCY
jgi:hypothetical protein